MIGVIRSHCVSGNMVITKTDSGSSVDSRETLVPIISAAAGAALAVVLQESFPVMAGIAGALAGAAAGMLLQKRNTNFALQPATIDPREVRINVLETELACERTMHEAFKRDAMQREEELKRRVEFAGTSGATIALLFVDLDRFKEINDTLGHEAGDVLLQQIAGTFGTAMRQDDFAARLGGDEFAVIVEIPPEEAREVAFSVAERVRQQLQFTVPAGDAELPIGATIGIALYPQDADSVAGLLHAADEVMYVGKRRGRNRVVTTDELKGEVA